MSECNRPAHLCLRLNQSFFPVSACSGRWRGKRDRCTASTALTVPSIKQRALFVKALTLLQVELAHSLSVPFSFVQPYVSAFFKGHTVKDGTRIQNYTKPQADSVISFLVLFFVLQRPSACHVWDGVLVDACTPDHFSVAL